ncbi:MAG: hypothetical protein ACI8QI_001624 [Limisphaerales bacterium]|jgi:hypothetical protein
MRAKIIAIILTVLGVTAALTLWFVPGRGVQSHTVRTLQLMQNILIDFDLLEESDTRTLTESVRHETNSSELNRRIAVFFQGSSDPYITNSARLVSVDGLYRDDWGTPLNFAVTNSFAYGRLKSEAKGRKVTPFTVWSSGQNKTNEFCFKDDLFLHP